MDGQSQNSQLYILLFYYCELTLDNDNPRNKNTSVHLRTYIIVDVCFLMVEMLQH